MKSLNSGLVNQSDVFMLLHILIAMLYYMEFKVVNQLQNWMWMLPREFLNASVLKPREICSILNLVGDLPYKFYILNNALICDVRKD